MSGITLLHHVQSLLLSCCFSLAALRRAAECVRCSLYPSYCSSTGGQLAGRIMCLNSGPGGENRTTLRGGAVGGLAAWSRQQNTSAHRSCMSCHHSTVSVSDSWDICQELPAAGHIYTVTVKLALSKLNTAMQNKLIKYLYVYFLMLILFIHNEKYSTTCLKMEV